MLTDTTQDIRRELETFEARLAANPHDRIAELNIARLEKQLAHAEQFDARVAQDIADREAVQQARAEQEQVALEAELRRRYDRAMPRPTHRRS